MGFGMGFGIGMELWQMGWDDGIWNGMGVGILPFPLIWLASILLTGQLGSGLASTQGQPGYDPGRLFIT